MEIKGPNGAFAPQELHVPCKLAGVCKSVLFTDQSAPSDITVAAVLRLGLPVLIGW